MSIKLPKLPYSINALEPYISEKTLEFHYGKHHKNYVNTLNKLIVGTPYEEMELKDIIIQTADAAGEREIFNNAAQAWNHTFFWNCMTPDDGGKPKGEALRLITEKFGSFQDFKDEFTESGKNLFGSGWVWLVKRGNDTLSIECMPDAGNPLTDNELPLLVCDVWEHAYYLDYQNDRAKFLTQFWKIVNWDFVEENLQKSPLTSPDYRKPERIIEGYLGY